MWEMMLTLNSHEKKKNANYYKVNQINKCTVNFKTFHQNIRGLGKKAGELLSHLHPDFPHVLCLTERHQKYLQLEKVHIKNYKLGALSATEKSAPISQQHQVNADYFFGHSRNSA
jgi:NAD-dependent SIR2 family protein deacetylase